MRLRKLKISNFRCFGPEETTINLNDLTAVIGSNSSGKTAALQALLKLFGTGKEREIRRSDFHLPHKALPEKIDKNEFYIEVEIDFPELTDKNNIADKTIPLSFTHMIVDDPGASPYARIRLEATWEKSNSLEGEIDTKLVCITVSENEQLKPEKHRKVLNPNELRSQIKVIYVPAVRNPSAELRTVSGTILWRILSGINWSEEIQEDLDKQMDQIDLILDSQEGLKKIREVIRNQWSALHKDVRYTEARITFNVRNLQSILKQIEISFAPTEIPKSYDVNTLSEGLRSLFYFCLVNSLLEIESIAQSMPPKDGTKLFNYLPPALTILAIEEPENHISPHLLGKVIKNVYGIASKSNAQVIFSSHSPAIIKRVAPESICHLRICEEELITKASAILLPEDLGEAYKYVRGAVIAYPDIYFSRLVILGEGASEEIIITKAIESLGLSSDTCGISIVPLGGRHVNHFWKLLAKLQIPYLTLLDLDCERPTGGWEKIKYVLGQLLEIGHNKEEIFSVDGENLSDTDFEAMHQQPLDTPADRDKLNVWIKKLETLGVYFSSPLDIDFSMLQSFKETYKGTIPPGGGPRIPNPESDADAHRLRVSQVTQQTLKGNAGNTYDPTEKELMMWYVYLFLNRGKPSSHILATTNLSKEEFKSGMPSSLRRLVDQVDYLLKENQILPLVKNKLIGD